MAGLVGAVAVAVAVLGELASERKKQKKQQKHQQQQRYLPVSLSLPLPLPVVGALSAGAALYFGWKRCRPRPQESNTNNNSHCDKVQEKEEEEEEEEPEEELSSLSLKDRSATDGLTLEDMNYHCKESQSQSLASGDYCREFLKLLKGKESVFPSSTAPESSSSANNSNSDDQEEEVTQGDNNVGVLRPGKPPVSGGYSPEFLKLRKGKESVVFPLSTTTQSSSSANNSYSDDQEEEVIQGDNNDRVLRPGKRLASGVYSPEFLKLQKGKESVSPCSTNRQSSSSGNNSDNDDQEEVVVQGDNNVRVLRPVKPRLDPEAMQRRSRILAEVDAVDLFGEFSLSPSSSSLICSLGSPRNIVVSRDCNEGSSATSGDGRVHAYEEYLSDPCLSPATRAQVLRAKSIVERLYRPEDQQVS